MTMNDKTLEVRLDEYVKYCISREVIEDYLYDTEELEVPSIGIFDSIFIKNHQVSFDILKEKSGPMTTCLDIAQDIQYTILQQAIFDHYKEDQLAYQQFLVAQFEKSLEDQDENANRLDILLQMYRHLPYQKSFLLDAVKGFIANKTIIEPYRYMVMLGFFVEAFTQHLDIDTLTTQQSLRRIAFQIPDKEEYMPNHTRYLSDALINLDSNLKENQAVFEFWEHNEQFPDIAEIAQSKLR